MERIGSIWTMIVRYLLLVMFGGVIVWACNSAGISVYADDGETPDGAELIRFDFHKSVNQEVGIPAGIPGFFTYFYEFLCARRADNRNWHLTREFLHFTSCRLDECCKIIYKRNRNNWG